LDHNAVDNGALAMKGMAADHLNHTRSPPGSFNLAQPYSCSSKTEPIKHIPLNSVPEQPQQPSIRSLEQHPILVSVNQLV
jgi:hypothetical protein